MQRAWGIPMAMEIPKRPLISLVKLERPLEEDQRVLCAAFAEVAAEAPSDWTLADGKAMVWATWGAYPLLGTPSPVIYGL